ncbi:protein-L-isoaspartate(D-aspartate) O-methyltransferase [Thiomonas sp.]|uniref:protein-L-isoaspartate(D-aspartate) O-methyltransferase n=1 Tax=Thiomonas sp. TaxID=2047785 RepID=UPI00344FD0CE
MSAGGKTAPRFVHWPARAVAQTGGTVAGRVASPSPPADGVARARGAAGAGPSRCVPHSSGLDSEAARRGMVDKLRQTGLFDERVLQALQDVPRHHFVEPALAAQAYLDNALPIGFEQTISKPSVVARGLDAALKALAPRPNLGKVLDIGTGCGYAAAVAARLAVEVYSIERIRALHELARNNLRALRVPNLRLIFGDGMLGCAAGAPYDVILSAAAAPAVPQAWLDQLAVGGVLIAPIGQPQQLSLYRKRAGTKFDVQPLEGARFVPLKSGLT